MPKKNYKKNSRQLFMLKAFELSEDNAILKMLKFNSMATDKKCGYSLLYQDQ